MDHILRHCDPPPEHIERLNDSRSILGEKEGGAVASSKKRKESESGGSIRPDLIDSHRKAACRKAFAGMISGACIAPTLVENPGFLKFCRSLNSRYDGVSASTVRQTDIPALYENVRRQILDLLDGSQRLTLGWYGFKGEDNEHVVNFCEGSGGSVAC